MPGLYERIDEKKAKDLRTLVNFVGIFCREKHRDEAKDSFPADPALQRAFGDLGLPLCADCRKLLHHGIAKSIQCPYDPKPMCKKCETHCYAPGYREKVREVMRFSGLYLVKHGRVDLMMHYFR
jgi:hypothetical protein